MKTEKLIKLASVFYFIAGVVFYAWKREFYSILNFSAGFVVVLVNFVFLEKLTVKLVSENPQKAGVIILVNIIRYPLIALVIYAIIQWNNFKAIPFVAGITSLVFGLMLSTISGGIKKNGS